MHLFTIWLACLFMFAAPASSFSAHETTQTTPEGDTQNSIVGTWKGAYFSYPELVAVTLTVRSLPMDRIEGECELAPAIEPQFRNSGTVRSYQFTGTYTPWATEFSFKPEKYINPRTNTMKPMNGVLDLLGDRLVGQIAQMQAGQYVPVVLARQPAGDKLLEEMIASAYPTAGAIRWRKLWTQASLSLSRELTPCPVMQKEMGSYATTACKQKMNYPQLWSHREIPCKVS